MISQVLYGWGEVPARPIGFLLTATGLVVATASLSGCASEVGAGGAPPSRIGGFFREMVDYLGRHDTVGVGDTAPDFALAPLRFYAFDLGETEVEAGLPADADPTIRLSDFTGKRPVALVFGSYT